MIRVRFNNTTLQVDDHSSLATFLRLYNYTTTGIAVIINQNLIPHSQYDRTSLNEGDIIEIMLPMQGG